MWKGRFLLIGLTVLFLLSACSNIKETSEISVEEMMQKNWETIEKEAEETTVNLYMWGGDEGINQYIDDWVAPQLKEQHELTLRRVPMDSPEVLMKLLNEKKAKQTRGTIDVIWLNGENFENAKKNELLFGPFSNQLPNVKNYVDTKALDVLYDFGTKVDGMEAPWGKVQFVFQYDQNKLADPPKTFEELKEWVKKNPGKFTYPDPSDFTGNAFLRHLFYESVGDVQTILDNGFDSTFAKENSQEMWDFLNEVKPYLWQEGKTYPNDLTQLDRLYSQGEVSITMGYNEARAEKLVEKGIFPDSTRSFILNSGSIGNTHFLAIPFNSPNKEGALTVTNFLLSPEAQLKKLDTSYWGDNTSLDIRKLSKEEQSQFEAIERGKTVIPIEILKEFAQPEIDANYVPWLKENWINEVVR
ncbi:ABC transporter substrate-binding protein [Carnobacterium funditum]|uniref:ABC transporter substrate-binding protein n=1 Tax=Carnobacterium funditum TaxID=2752 RepID=UPI0005589880|nr:ABC transporter substrate-binding protein [Carnobacterium funditum]